MVSTVSPVRLAARSNLPSASTACMNSSETRTELLAFWYWTLVMSLPPRSMSYPASRRTRILSSSRALVWMNSAMSGWSTSRTTILAARRVAPPDLIVPAEASAPRMNDTGPLAVPPDDSNSRSEEHTSELQSHSDLHPFPTRRSSDLGVAQDPDLVLFARLGLDELCDVGVVNVEDDHLGSPACRAARLDRARGGVGAAHERHRAARGTARRQQLQIGRAHV